MDMCNLTTLKGMLEDFDAKYLNESQTLMQICDTAMETCSSGLMYDTIKIDKDMRNSVNNTTRMVMDIYGEIRQIKKDIKELKIQIEELMQAKNSDKASLCLDVQQDKYINNIGGK